MVVDRIDEHGNVDEPFELGEEVSVLKHKMKHTNVLLRDAGNAILKAHNATHEVRMKVKTKQENSDFLKVDVLYVMNSDGGKIVGRALIKVLPLEANQQFTNGRRY